jgi:hypothetical protein
LDKDRKAQSTSRSSSQKNKATQRSQTKRPAAPPPDIGAGIGIGGIF